MVRTYAFNPSMQSGLMSDGSASLPALVLHSAMPPRQQPSTRDSDSHQRQRPTPASDANWGRQQKGPSLDSLVSSGASVASSSSTAVIQEEQTSIFSIRSVLINGQRFFQHLEVAPSHGTTPTPPTVQPLLAIAAQKEEAMNGKIGHRPDRNWLQTDEQLKRPLNGNGPGQPVQPPNGLGHRENGQMLMPTRRWPANEGVEELPWARGNPQPKSGLRGSREWQAAQQKNAFDFSFGSSTLSWPPGDSQFQQRAEQERHRLELLRQIEENRARKARESRREWEAEERQRMKDELWQQRQRLEMEEERRKEREKALLAELKAAKLAEVRRATEEALMREAKMREQVQGRRRPRRQEADDFGHEGNVEESEEWWERKDRIRAQQLARERTQSPALPAVQRRMKDGSEVAGGRDQRSMSVGSRASRKGSAAFGRQSRLGYSPSTESRKSTMNGGGRQRSREEFR